MESELSATLRAKRASRGLSVARLALRIGVSRQAIHDWERGLSRPSPTNCDKLATELQLDPDYVRKLAGHAADDASLSPTDKELLARAEEFKSALLDVPRPFWGVVTEAFIQLSRTPWPNDAVTRPPDPPVTRPKRPSNRKEPPPAGEIRNSYQEAICR